MKRKSLLLVVVAVVAGCGGDDRDTREEAEERCRSRASDEVPAGCAESELDACVRCRMSCGDQCAVAPKITTCRSENWSCGESQ